MASAINIPSPSVFLRSSPPPADPPAAEKRKPPDRKNAPPAKRQNSAAEGKKKAARKPAPSGSGGAGGGDGVVKPKQSKSRNGRSMLRSCSGGGARKTIDDGSPSDAIADGIVPRQDAQRARRND